MDEYQGTGAEKDAEKDAEKFIDPKAGQSSDYSNSTYTNPDKDSLYSWVILACSCMIQLISVGLALSSGTFTPYLIEKFGDRSAAAWVGALQTGFLFFGGPITGFMLDRFGYRRVVMCGAIMGATGLAVSSCANKIWILYITYGLLGGLGFSFTYISAVTILANYFDKYQTIAFSVASTGAGIGVLIQPHLIHYLTDQYSLRGGYILVAGIALQMVICGALLREPITIREEKTISTRQELSILCEWRFNIFLLNNFLFNFGSLIVFVLISDYAEYIGMSRPQGVMLISILGISNAFGRGFVAVLGMCRLDNMRVYTITCILSGIAICLVTVPLECPGPCYYIVAVGCAGYGIFFGTQLANLAIVTNQLVGAHRLNAAYGVAMFMNGGGAATGPPFAGFIFAYTGSYTLAFLIAGGTVILAGLIMIPILIMRRQLPPEDEVEGVTMKQLNTVDQVFSSACSLASVVNNKPHRDYSSLPNLSGSRILKDHIF